MKRPKHVCGEWVLHRHCSREDQATAESTLGPAIHAYTLVTARWLVLEVFPLHSTTKWLDS